MFEPYIRNEEEVTAAHFDGSESMMFELKDTYPDCFEIRKAAVSDKSSRMTLIVRDGRSYAAVKPGDYIVFDSCGKAQIYEPEMFGIMFRDAKQDVEAEALARKLFELDFEKSSHFEFDELDDDHRLFYLEQARLLLDEYIVVRRDTDELF